jgi:hypothetical protein
VPLVIVATEGAVRHARRMSYAPWAASFRDADDPDRAAEIRLRQLTATTFALESSLVYVGETGVSGLPEAARTLRPVDLGPDGSTDLTSVPHPLRWFVGAYGVHTPAALLHDRLIDGPGVDGVTDTQADRFFRFMLRELGVRRLRRWMMWSAVALGSRWRAGGVRRATLVVWVLLATAGLSSFVVGLVARDATVVALATVAPLPAALLWGRQYGAGLVAAATAIWVLPPTVLGAVGFWVYAGLERLLGLVLPAGPGGDQPVEYRHF